MSHSFQLLLIVDAGNFAKIFDINAWDFHKEIGQKCALSLTFSVRKLIFRQMAGSSESMPSLVYERT